MIKAITEKEYRALPFESSSSIKDFSKDRRKYYKRHVLKEKVEDKYNEAILTGQIVETLLLEPEKFDEIFHMSACATIPTAMMLDFVTMLAKITVGSTRDGICTRPFLDMAEEAYEQTDYKIKLESVIKKFDGSDAEIYYNELVKTSVNDYKVVTPKLVNNAERIVDELQTNPTTKAIVTLKSGGDWEVINQMKIADFTIFEMKFKAMLDSVIINHTTKVISWYDLKCTWSVENFYKEYYLYRNAYLQGYIYYYALLSLTINPEHRLFEYTVDLPTFMVCDSINYNAPLIYKMDKKNMDDALNGFKSRGYWYPGLYGLIKDLHFAKDNDKWKISRENYLNHGIVELNDDK